MMSPATADVEVLTICYEPWEPYIYKDDSGEVLGVAVELMNEALAELGYKAKYKEMPFRRCVSSVRNDHSDIAMPITAGKNDIHDSSTVFAHWTLAAIVPADSPLKSPVSLAQLMDERVIIIDGYDYPPKITRWFESHPSVVEVSYSSDGSGLVPFNMLELKRADVFVEDNYWSENLIQEEGFDLRVLEPALDSAISVAGFRPGLAELRDNVDRVLAERGQAFRNQLFQKYTGHTESYFSGQPDIL